MTKILFLLLLASCGTSQQFDPYLDCSVYDTEPECRQYYQSNLDWTIKTIKEKTNDYNGG